MPAEAPVHPCLELTRRMHAAAARADWSEVARLNDARKSAAAAPVAAVQVMQLREIIRLDEAVVALASAARAAAARRVIGLRRGSEAAGAYRRESGSPPDAPP